MPELSGRLWALPDCSKGSKATPPRKVETVVMTKAKLSIVIPPVPTLTSISPTYDLINTAFTTTLTGTNFTSSSTVAINGVIVPSTFGSSTQLTISVPASDVGPRNCNFSVIIPSSAAEKGPDLRNSENRISFAADDLPNAPPYKGIMGEP
jgi:IPT/TIG domain